MRVVAFVTLTSICAFSQHLIFEPDRSGSSFLARTRNGAVRVASDGATLSPARGQIVQMRIERGRATQAVPLDTLPGMSNYFKGSDPSQWRTRVPQYARVKYKDVYPGIDLVYYGNDHNLEYDFVVGPGADPDKIQLAFDGADRVTTASNGDLLIEAAGQVIRQLRPRVYQWDGGRKREIAGAYRVRPSSVQFALSRYDRTRPLIIDPVIQYSTYIGRGGQESGVGIAVDAAGNSYIVGETTSGELATSGVAQTDRAGDQDAFVAKLSPNGTILYVTYLGGNRTDTGLGIAVDEAGNAYVTGVTFSTTFPVRSEFAATPAGGTFDSFVAKLNPTGSQLAYSTYLGGRNQEWASGIAVDAQGGAWITGWTTSPDFPVRTPYQSASAGGGEDIFITRLSPTGSSITYSTYFGGNGRDISTGIAVDSTGAVYVTGGTTSTAFPLNNAAQRTNAGEQDAFAFKLVPATNSLEYSTFLGGTGDDLAVKIAVDPAGNAYIAGYTKSTGFPATGGSFQMRLAGGTDVFVAKLAPTGVVDYATHIGGSGDDWAGGIAVDAAGSAYVAGWTNSTNFPMRNAMQSTFQSGDAAGQNFDAVVVRVSPNGDDLLYSTFLGGRGEDKAYGVALDRSNNVLVAGSTTSPNLPNPNNEFSPSGRGITDVFLTRISADAAVTVLAARPTSLTFTARAAEPSPAAQTVTLTSTGLPQTFQTSRSAPWIVIRPETGSTPSNLVVSVDASGLQPGTHTGDITVRSAVSTLRIPVTLTVLVAPNIVSVTPSPINRSDVDVPITVTGGGFTTDSFVEVNGLRATTTFIDNRNLRAVVPSSQTFQQGALSITVVNPEARSNTLTLQVVTTGQPTVVHGATRQPGPVAPGQIVILSGAATGADVNAAAQDGRLPTSVSDTRVLFDETPAPILWLQAGQVAVIAPYNLFGRTSSAISVEYRGVRSTPATVAVAASSPGLFTTDGRQATALNENGTVNSVANPAARGSILVLYATGEGLTNPTLADGSIVPLTVDTPKPMLPVSVSVGGFSTEVLYAGAVPGSAAGLMQINVRLPQGIASGAQPVSLTIGSATSPAGVTVAIQ